MISRSLHLWARILDFAGNKVWIVDHAIDVRIFPFFGLCMRVHVWQLTYRPYRMSRSREIVTHQGQEAVTLAGRVIFALLQFAEMNIKKWSIVPT